MSFDRAWVLLLACLPLVWLWWEWRHSPRRLGLTLKALALLCLILALAGPKLSLQETKLAVAVLVDSSASVDAGGLSKASEIVNRIERARGRHQVAVHPFARSLRAPLPRELDKQWRFQPSAGEAGRGTDLERAVRESIGMMPAGLVPRLVLVSDGRENRGSVTRAAWQARQLGIPIDTFALEGRPRPALRLDSVTMPSLVFSGERFPIDIAVESPRAVTAEVEIQAEGKTLGATTATLQAGRNDLRMHASVNSAGVVELAGSIRAEGMGELRFARAVALRKPRVLLISDDPPGTTKDLLRVLEASQFIAQPSRTLPRGALDDYQVVVFNNWDLESIPPPWKAGIERFVQQGGGLLVIGGEKNTYAENKKIEDALDRAMPAKLAPPRSPEGTSVVLILDKSSSMEGKKMELARLAAIGVVENLRPIDMVGVLIFDNSFQWAVPIRKAEDKTLIKRLIAGVMPDGGTQIAPALAESYRRILPMQATFKHIVLLTDGISEEGDSMALAREAATQKVTISTVGLGQDVNRAYLEKVAALAKGKSHFVLDPNMLEQVLLRDVMEHTGSTAVEKPIVPDVAHQAEILEGVDVENAPPLKGYVRFISKPTADTILTIDKKDPLLARWQYGLGRAVVFTSDAKSRWAADWVGWKGFDKFWANIFRDLLPHTQQGEASLDFDSAGGELTVEYRLARHTEEPAGLPAIFALGPEGFRRPVAVKKVTQGVWRGSVPVGNRQGLFRVRPLEDSRVFPEVGYYREEQELSDYGSDPGLLKSIAEFTGGRFEPQPREIFQSGGRATPSTMRLWPGLLALALLLNLAELLNRKWKGILEFFEARRMRRRAEQMG